MGYYEESNCPANTPFIIVGGAAGDIGYSTVEFWAADDCVFITGNADIINRYIFYVLMKNSAYIKSNVRKASIPRLSRSVLERLIIPVPPLPIQREIVKILDNFTELTAELTARQKQYEYYRDLLLTFSDVDNSQNVHVERGGTGRSDG